MQTAPPLLRSNDDVVLHHMHDQVQDELMVARMTYFRLKWNRLPEPYERFLAESLLPRAPVIVVEDASTWPVVRIGERHVFQAGAQGGQEPADYLARTHTPSSDDISPEAEWGSDPGFAAAIARWGADQGHPLVRLTYTGPQSAAHAVAATFHAWYEERDETADRLLVSSFVLADPWRAINTAAVPFWTFFSVQPALRSLEAHLDSGPRYRAVDLLLFQHGVRSPGIAEPERWMAAIRRRGATPRLLALHEHKFPHDIATLGRYGPALAGLPTARRPWPPLASGAAVDSLCAAGLEVSTT